MAGMDAEKPTRRRLFRRVWNVLLVIALVAVLGLGWLGVEASTVRHRRAMIEQIEAAGGGFDGSYIYLPPVLARPACNPPSTRWRPAPRSR